MSDVDALASVDLDACAAEPIRIPGGIQPHGAVMVADPETGRVLQASANLSSFTGLDLAAGAETRFHPVLAQIVSAIGAGEAATMRTIVLAGRTFQASAHRTAQGVIVEFEPPPAPGEPTLETLYPRIRSFMTAIGDAASLEEIARAAVEEVRALTGFNRVLLYSFDAKGVGTVLAESTDDVLPSYLNLRFPAEDIPAQARDLYKLSRIRLIPDVNYVPAPLDPADSPLDGAPLDLGRAALRSVSPVHREYMRNMGTASSMSISIIVSGELWGLVSGHSRDAQHVGAQVRSACDHLGQVLSLQIEALEKARRSSETLRLRNVQTELLARLAASASYAKGLAESPDSWAFITGAEGAALVSGDDVVLVGLAPTPDEIREIAARLFADRHTEVALESMAEAWPESAAYADVASGLLAVSVSQIHPNYLMWFRPEAIRTVAWAGEPQKPRELGERLHPRKSFQLWKEQVRLRSRPWTAEEIDSARTFRAAIQDFVLRRAEERAELTNRLAETNRELESFSYSISHDLRAPFRHVVGFAELLNERVGGQVDETARHYLQNIKDAALAAGQLVDDLLNFSQLGRHSLDYARVNMNRLAGEVRRNLAQDIGGRRVTWTIGDLPSAWGDAAMLRQVLQNLMHNAVKYTEGRDPALISVTGEALADTTTYTVSDNGVGFEMAYAHKLFAVFERLHKTEEFAGTGIGLALVRRIVERHGGTVSAHSALGAGASFTVTLPNAIRPETPET